MRAPVPEVTLRYWQMSVPRRAAKFMAPLMAMEKVKVSMGFYSGLMGFYSGLMGFYSGLMGY